MDKHLSSLARRVLSPGQRSALHRLLDWKGHVSSLAMRIFSPGEYSSICRALTEFEISRYHRHGLRMVRDRSLSRPTKINLGSGEQPKQGYLNVDLFPGGDVTLDLRRNLPFESNCCDFILSEHCFEHIEYPGTVSNLLRECLRILKPGGMLRFSVPDTEWPLLDYGKGGDAGYFRACRENSWWHPSYCTTRLEHINYHFRQGEEHRFAYDEETARKILEAAGFTNVQRVSFDPAIDSKDRELGGLFMSARKPA
jgi:predicted SAM-dependent methyltransferase